MNIPNHDAAFLIFSHVLWEAENLSTHYGIIRHGKMICQLTAAPM